MKRLKFILSTLLVMFAFNAAVAQAEQKKAIHDAMNFGKNKADVSKIPAKYAFSWKYSMNMKTAAGKTMIMDYFLEPNASYYGANMKRSGSDMFMIMDTKNKMMVNCFNKGAKKMAMASKMPDYSNMDKTQNSKYTYKSLPNKVILGFNCKGIQATNANSTMIFYYTNDAKVSFSELFKSQQNQSYASGILKFFKPNEKPLMMSMEYTDLKDKSKKITMTCIGLEKQAYTFNKSDYQFM